jgi:hypothetical protein
MGFWGRTARSLENFRLVALFFAAISDQKDLWLLDLRKLSGNSG